MDEVVFVTPSYRGDIQRFLLMRKSLLRFSREKYRHYVVVPKEDRELFLEKADRGVIVLSQNDFVASYFYPHIFYRFINGVAPGQSWRFEHLGGRAGWIIQQIIKMSIPEIAPGKQVVFLDSDMVFMRPFSVDDFGISEGRNVLIRIEPNEESAKQREHIRFARDFLELRSGETDHHYMSCPNIWHSRWVLELRKRIECIHSKHWQRALFESERLSEYSLYGVFVEEFLKPQNLFVNKRQLWKIIWDKKSFFDFFKDKKEWDDPAFCLIVQSNIGISVDEYEQYLKNMWNSVQ